MKLVGPDNRSPMRPKWLYALGLCATYAATSLFLTRGAGFSDQSSSVVLSLFITAFCLSLPRSVRVPTVTIVSSIALFEIYVSSVYSGMTASLLSAVIGVGLYEPRDGSVEGALKNIPYVFICFSFIYICVTGYFSYQSHRNYSLIRAGKFLIIMFVFFIFPIAFEYQFYGYQSFLMQMRQAPSFIAHHYVEKFRFVFGTVSAAGLIIVDDMLTSAKYATVTHDSIPPGLHAAEEQSRNIVVIVGEASNPSYYTVYNPAKTNTPQLEQMRASGDVCVVDQVHSNANLTRNSVPMFLSFAGPAAFDNLFKYKNIVELARDSGYRTHWLSSSESGGLWGKTYAFISDYADVIVRPDRRHGAMPIAASDDDALVPIAQHYFQSAGPKNLFVFHIFGNHMKYSRNVDKADIAALPDGSDYDRSIHHTDRFVSQIYALARQYLGNFEFIYAADHGEIVGVGHGFRTTKREMYLIPMIMRNNAYCGLVDRLRSADGFFGITNVKYLLAQMLGYQLDLKALEESRQAGSLLLTEHEDIMPFDSLNP